MAKCCFFSFSWWDPHSHTLGRPMSSLYTILCNAHAGYLKAIQTCARGTSLYLSSFKAFKGCHVFELHTVAGVSDTPNNKVVSSYLQIGLNIKHIWNQQAELLHPLATHVKLPSHKSLAPPARPYVALGVLGFGHPVRRKARQRCWRLSSMGHGVGVFDPATIVKWESGIIG